LITDPPITSGGSSVTNAGTGFGGQGITGPGGGNTVVSGGYELVGGSGSAADADIGGGNALAHRRSVAFWYRPERPPGPMSPLS
jgi:hypothetical protein